LLAVGGKVRFGVFAAEGQLLDVAQVLFVFEEQVVGLSAWRSE
jgi:hypothetical protein